MLRAGLARAAAAARRAAQSGGQAARCAPPLLRSPRLRSRDPRRPLHSAATAAAATLGWPAALVGGAAAATAWATLDEGDAASGLRRVAVATRHLVPVLADWKAHEVRRAARCFARAQRASDAQQPQKRRGPPARRALTARAASRPRTSHASPHAWPHAPRSCASRCKAWTRLQLRRMRPPHTRASPSACATWRSPTAASTVRVPSRLSRQPARANQRAAHTAFLWHLQ